MREPIKTEDYKDHVINIYPDDTCDTDSPREWDNVGHMVCFHNRYALGDKDKQGISTDDFQSWDAMEDHIRQTFKPVVLQPLYLYDHSGITMSTAPFSCPWDSGQVGFIWATREDVLKEYGKKKLTKKLVEKVAALLVAEVDVYDAFIRGDVYGYEIVDRNGNTIDGCWGYIGKDGDDVALAAARESVDAITKERVKNERKKSK